MTKASPPRRAPGALHHVAALLWLRTTLAAGGRGASGRLFSLGTFLLASAPAGPLALSAFLLLSSEAGAPDRSWELFWLALLGLSCAVVWLAWPMLAAGVDDHSEASRYAAFPVTPLRLLLVSTAADLLEPIAVIVYAPVLGAVFGFALRHPPSSWPVLVLLVGSFLYFCAAWGRVGLHVVLEVLRREKSAETIGGFFFVVLAIAAALPAVDVSWLAAAAKAGEGLRSIDLDLLTEAVKGLTRFPTGWLARGLHLLATDRASYALVLAFGYFVLGTIGMAIALRLLVRFHQSGGRGDAPVVEAGGRDPFSKAGGLRRALLAREVLDLWRNPRARMLAAVPFLLAVALELLSARSLALHLLGPVADALLASALSVYAGVVVASTFGQNLFGYDGRGFAALLAAPIPLGFVLRARLTVLGAAALGLSAATIAFYRLWVGPAPLPALLFAATSTVTLVAVQLGAGAWISLYFPVRFHASLKRRDAPPLTATMLGFVAAAIGGAGPAALLRSAGQAGPGAMEIALGALLAAAAVAALLVIVPRAERALEGRAEAILHAVTRD